MKNHLIKRSPHDKENPYFMMRTDTAQNKALSYEARGMLAYLLSQPDHWQVKVFDLILDAPEGETTKAGKAKVYGILDELAEHGYIKKPKRYRGDNGRWQWTPYEVYEAPHTDLRDMAGPEMVPPDMAGPDTVNRYCKESTESVSTDLESTEKKQEPPNPQAGELEAMKTAVKEQLKLYGSRQENVAKQLLNLHKGKKALHNIGGTPATPNELARFCTDYRKQHPNLSLPLKMEAVNDWFNRWRDGGLKVVPMQPARSQLPEHRIVTPEELEVMAGQRQPHELTPNERVNNDIRDLANILRAPGSKTA